MNKVIVRTRTLSQALFSLATAGCDTVEISVVEHAVKVEGQRDGETLTLHVWSREAEETEAQVGKGEALAEEEQGWLDKGKCPKCSDHGQTYKGPREGLAILVACDAGHTFWIPPLPLLPEYHGQHKEEPPEEIAEAVKELKEAEGEAEDTK